MPSSFEHEPALTVAASNTTAGAAVKWVAAKNIGESLIILDSGGNGRIGLAGDLDLITLTANTVTVAGTVAATTLTGAGAGITALAAANITASGTLPALNGAALTALNGTQVTSGTIPVAQLGSSGSRSSSTFLNGANAWAAAGRETTTIIKVSIESSPSNTTLQNDNELYFAMAANTTYFVELLLQAGGTNDGGGLKVGWALPTGATYKAWSWGMQNNSVGTAHVSTNSHQQGDWTIVTGASGKNCSNLLIRSRIANGSNTGNAQFQWAQEASSGNAATMAAGCVMTYIVVN